MCACKPVCMCVYITVCVSVVCVCVCKKESHVNDFLGSLTEFEWPKDATYSSQPKVFPSIHEQLEVGS